MKKHIWAGIIYFLMLNPIMVNSDPQDSLTLLESILPQHCIFSNTFIQQKEITNIPTPLTSKGQMLFACNQGLVWHNQQPFDEVLIYTTQDIHFRGLENDELMLLEGPQHYYLARFLLNLLSANTEFITDNFDIVYDKKTTTESTIAINLLPTNELIKKGLKEIKLTKIQPDSEQAKTLNIMIIDNNGQNTTMELDTINIYDAKTYSANGICAKIFSEKNNTCSAFQDPLQYQNADFDY